MQATSAGVVPRAPPSDREQKMMDILLHAPDTRVAPLLACVKGWAMEAQADLANWRDVLWKLHRLLLSALQQCPLLLVVESEVEKTKETAVKQTEQELTEQVFEVLKFSGYLLENAANKAVYPSTEPVMALFAAKNERVVTEAIKVVAMLALPPQVHRYAADPTSFVEPVPSKNSLLRRRLLAVAKGRGTLKNSMELVDSLNAETFETFKEDSDPEGYNASYRVVSTTIPPYEEVVRSATSPGDAAYVAAICVRAPDYRVQDPKEITFSVKHARADAWDVMNYVEQHPELIRGIVELLRVESIERVPVRMRVAACLVLTALVNDRIGRAGGRGVLGHVIQTCCKWTPHGVFPSLVRYCMADLGDGSTLDSVTKATISASPPPLVGFCAGNNGFANPLGSRGGQCSSLSKHQWWKSARVEVMLDGKRSRLMNRCRSNSIWCRCSHKEWNRTSPFACADNPRSKSLSHGRDNAMCASALNCCEESLCRRCALS
ncbi:hypothetical protein PsorP6_010027 [Peronosclerospora sorghi]|uniref:Uncharacterized protein n=1 Tax=Peronosclerospora sorghi TaxID=230839 RepID=A0ACC0VWP8_9STRA|nr:hypothetical protein PsorP6_010027 [Peronosclerospora sorghi]